MSTTQYRVKWKNGVNSYWFDYLSMAQMMLDVDAESGNPIGGEVETRSEGNRTNE